MREVMMRVDKWRQRATMSEDDEGGRQMKMTKEDEGGQVKIREDNEKRRREKDDERWETWW